MARQKLSRNAPCPQQRQEVQSLLYSDKGFERVEDEAGTVYKSTPMTPEVTDALEQFRQALIT
jgi:hypothetical protein